MYKIYDNVILLDGRQGTIVEVFETGVYMVEVEEPEWDFFVIKENEIRGTDHGKR